MKAQRVGEDYIVVLDKEEDPFHSGKRGPLEASLTDADGREVGEKVVFDASLSPERMTYGTSIIPQDNGVIKIIPGKRLFGPIKNRKNCTDPLPFTKYGFLRVRYNSKKSE